ncbi:sulfite exporter TauE/SafE family protein [Trueperella bialowiezensis]|uniref:Probable membrane transporter protein n=1 Tax=Trueperella bialowiezensis TaxID=312285 RepID=A0A448PG94_9ACTO|nr:sulfite exporter TauE/SafE family protein [Trueperella bialowiezensis]VEI13936.1 Sulfite exporter TauE/SafE [Trueperella bialowiezensis]
MDIVVAAIAGLGIGVVVGMLGAGGGILSVPALVYFLGFSPHEAAAGSLVIVALSAVTALWSHARAGNVNWRGGVLVAAASSLGAIGGARLAPLLSGRALMITFSILLCAVGIAMVRSGFKARTNDAETRDSRPARHNSPRPWAIIAGGLGVGLLAGVFGVGGGFAVVPMLVYVFGFSMREAAGTSVLVMAITAVFGLLGRIGTDVTINWPVIAVFAAASALGGLVGAPISRKVSAATLTIAFGALLLAIAAITAIQNVC